MQTPGAPHPLLDPTAFATDLSLKLLQQAPKGIKSAITWVRSRRLLVVGQERSGKTSLVTYLESATLFPEGYTATSYGFGKLGDKDFRKTKSFIFKSNTNGTMQLNLRHSIDVIGQASAIKHAQFVRVHKPHALVIMTDMSSSLTGSRGAETWLKEFLDQLSYEYQHSMAVRRSLKCIVVVLNKADLSTDFRIKQRQKKFRAILRDKLTYILGQRERHLSVLPCILVETPKGQRLADAMIRKIAQELQEPI